ncbi:OapA N-terminal domain-containing protein [Ensifer adhaerens]|uniref:OapA N-terminal domain-containing protein n=1 Tax=Ensifer adhaerens TaxID=106592 RepID=UPI00384FD75C
MCHARSLPSGDGSRAHGCRDRHVRGLDRQGISAGRGRARNNFWKPLPQRHRRWISSLASVRRSPQGGKPAFLSMRRLMQSVAGSN